jgi:hypothetical protein
MQTAGPAQQVRAASEVHGEVAEEPLVVDFRAPLVRNGNSEVGALGAASFAGEPLLNIRQPNIVGPLIGAESRPNGCNDTHCNRPAGR